MAGKGRNKRHVGLYAKNYAKPVRWKLDMDYIDVLSEADKAWLSNNLQALYGARADHALAEGWDYDSFRESSRYVNATRRDVYSLREAVGQRSTTAPEVIINNNTGKGAIQDFMAAKAKEMVEADYPLSEGIVWTKVKAGGWVVAAVKLRGSKVVDEELLTRSQPVSFGEAATVAVNELPKRLQEAMAASKRS